MEVQILKDSDGNQTGVFIPINDWNKLTEKYKELKNIIETKAKKPSKLSKLAGKLSTKTSKEMLKYVSENRKDWEKRLPMQF